MKKICRICQKIVIFAPLIRNRAVCSLCKHKSSRLFLMAELLPDLEIYQFFLPTDIIAYAVWKCNIREFFSHKTGNPWLLFTQQPDTCWLASEQQQSLIYAEQKNNAEDGS
ncbi:hypothetical protein [Catenibacillus scindens]|uniref:hypothetical protein n=1 Tax=Catenibacillus scindens TaxID=673271 RepID=UPI001619A5DF|nr:hypothetical protein [Catenibacillus scindens]